MFFGWGSIPVFLCESLAFAFSREGVLDLMQPLPPPRISVSKHDSYAIASWSVIVSLTGKWASTRENLSSGVANNTGADQPAHPRSLISAFVIRYMKSIVVQLASCEILIF